YYVNPSLHGHVAIEVDDIEQVKQRLNARGVYFADPGHWAVEGLYQIYVIDPSMNCVEINQQLDT
ncbi:MAG: glyoxalase, partial [Acidimicrobiia bacterium]|nr:glyoxalase [Acidimicrobiia bacterium]